MPLLLFREHQKKLSELTKTLTEITHDYVQQGFKKVSVKKSLIYVYLLYIFKTLTVLCLNFQISSEMKTVLSENSDKPYIVCKLQSVGDGKKIVNYALDNSPDKPVMYFVQDGYKSIICSCRVPKVSLKLKTESVLDLYIFICYFICVLYNSDISLFLYIILGEKIII